MKLRTMWPFMKLVPLSHHEKPLVTIKIGGGCFCKSRGQIEADPVLLEKIVEWLVHVWNDGKINVIVVVSAPGGKTDALIQELHTDTPHPSVNQYAEFVCKGETEMARQLAQAINRHCIEHGLCTNASAPAKAFDAKAMGMTADRTTRAITAIKRVDALTGWTQRQHRGIPICAGFQALSSHNGRMIDLGRGGSDASAVAIAVATHCQLCVVLKDVPQVVAAPPNLVPGARSFDFISYPLMYRMARTGSRILMARAVSLAQDYMLPILVALCPGFSDDPKLTEAGTLIWCHPLRRKTLERFSKINLGLGAQSDLSGFTVYGIPNQPGVLAQIFSALPDVVIGDSAQGLGQPPNISFTIPTSSADAVAKKLQAVMQPGWHTTRQDGLAAVTMVGAGLLDDPGYLLRIAQSLTAAGVNIEMLSTSHDAITCVTHSTQLQRAAQTVAAAFDLLQN